MSGSRDETRTPVRRPEEKSPETVSTRADIDAFVQRARAVGPRSDGKRGRLIFALDATMSRQPMWDLA
jgi:hypothetical protein